MRKLTEVTVKPVHPVRPGGQVRPVHRFIRVIHLVIVCGVAMATAIAGVTGLIAYSTHEQEMSNHQRELQQLAYILADHMDRNLESVGMVQSEIIRDLQAKGIETPEAFTAQMSTEEVRRQLSDRIGGLPQVDALSLVNSAGKVINLSRTWSSPGADVTDREYFTTLSQPDGPDSFLSEPVRNRSNGIWTVFAARRLASPGGEFLGIALCALQLSTLQDFYQRAAAEPGRSIALIRNDGVLLARYPAVSTTASHGANGDPVFRMAIHLPASEFMRQDSVWDGQDSLTAVQRSTRFPIVVEVSSTARAAMASWTHQCDTLLVVAGLLELAVVAMMIGGVKLLRSQILLSKANQARERSWLAATDAELTIARERAAAAQQAYAQDRRFGTALDNMSQGLCMFDGDNKLLVANAQIASVLGVPPDAVQVGMGLHDFLALGVHAEGFSAMQADAVEMRLLSLNADRQGASAVLPMQDGRSVAYSFRPMEESNGWVLTCEDVTDQRKAEQRIMHMARHDALTNLPNRVLLRERIEEAAARALRGDEFAVLCLDLDHFKTVNDTLGHPVGDALLQDVTARLLRCVRETDTVARIGGDEFVVLQRSDPVPAGATALAIRLVEELSLPYMINGHQIVIGTSIGISIAPSDSADPDELLKHADLALYRAKSDGGSCYRFFEREMDARMQTRRQLEVDLRQALQQQEFRLFYQPLVNRTTRCVTAFEALLRWEHPQRGLVNPSEFIPMAEDIGLISAIGEWALTEACVEAAKWPAKIKVAVNLSSHQFTKCPALVTAVKTALQVSGLAPNRLELEITESVLLQDTDDTLETLHALKRFGVRVSMDDFGTGYSSLSYLQKFPFDKVKIDQSFIRGLGVRHDCAAIVHAISGLCSSLGITTTAEGVETEDQMLRLEGEHCEEVQGYLFSPPRPAAEILTLIERLSHQAVALVV